MLKADVVFKLPQLSAALIFGRFTHPDWLIYIESSSFIFSGQSKEQNTASPGRRTKRQWNSLETFQEKCSNNESKHKGKKPTGMQICVLVIKVHLLPPLDYINNP